MVEIIFGGKTHEIFMGGKAYAKIVPIEGAVDTFEKIEDGVWRWHRHTEKPTDHMRMELVFYGEPDFTMVPSVSYNGNGWGDTPEYVGDFAEDGTPWSWAWHRVTVPGCTYSENSEISIALMCDANTNCACSLYKIDEGKNHVLIFPEEEKPKTLHRHFWEGPFEGTMEPTQDFEGIIFTHPSDGTKFRYKHILDFAWRYYGHEMKPAQSAKELYRLSLAFCNYLFEREKSGFAGFSRGAQWNLDTTSYKKTEHIYEVGWAGQSASLANAFIYDYLRTGDKDKLSRAIETHDSWMEMGKHPAGHITSRLAFDEASYREPNYKEEPSKWDYGENIYENMYNMYRAYKEKGEVPNIPRAADGRRLYVNDACSNGTVADCYFEAYDLLREAGIEKPEYLEFAFGICDFALKSQDENGCFAKSWQDNGEVLSKKGTIGCFLILPMLRAYEKSGDKKYLDAATRAFDFYYSELERDGFTTAGALDTYSIDKESASPLLRDAIALYDATGDKKYVACAETVAWYLSSWMMYCTVDYPEECLIKQLGYDTFGGTSVSTPHNALDMYALRDVISFERLASLTGNVQWRERAIVLWCHATQLISDGTLYAGGRLRPAGSQDEAVFHTRWGRKVSGPFVPTQWFPNWPCAFRLENLRWHKDWGIFDEGLTNIEGKINK